MDIRNVEFAHTLSPTQEAILLDKRPGAEPRYPCGQLKCALQGLLNVSTFEKSWRQVVRENAILRTAFSWKRVKKPLQLVLKQLDIPLSNLDWRGSSAEEQRRKWHDLASEEWRRGFDPSAPPLMSLNLCRIADNRFRFVWTYHSLLLDDRSARLVLNQVCSVYDEIESGRSNPRLERTSFRDYVSRSRRARSSSSEAFWREELEDLSPMSALLPGGGGVPCLGSDYNFHRARFNEEADLAVRALAESAQASLKTIVLGGWATLLSRYGGEDEVVFGVGCPARSEELKEAEDLIGPLTNALPLRVRLDPNASVREFLQDIEKRQSRIAAQSHCSPTVISQLAGLTDDAALFESKVIVEEDLLPWRPTMAQGVDISRIEMIEAPATPVTLKALGGSKREWQIVYDQGRFDSSTMERMLGHLQNLMAEMALDPNARCHDLSLLTNSERRQILKEWNDTKTEYPRWRTIQGLFEEQAKSRPDKIAIVFGDQSLTYRHLDKRANRVARYLRALGVGPDVLVGLCCERSLEMIVGMLGIVKAGAAYVPLDAAYPMERLDFMLADTQAPVLLTQERLLDHLPSHWGQVICLDADWNAVAEQNDAALPDATTSENLAYVMYTSGSTGQPKGVAITQRNVSRLVKQVNYASLSSEEVFLQLAPVSFDASTFEIWGSLLNGARLVVMEEAAPSLEEIGEAIRRHEISTLWLTASLFHLMVDERPEDLSPLTQLLAGGDALSPNHVGRALSRFGRRRLINGYGPTESTTFACTSLLQGHESLNGSVPIGRPISNTQAYILDRRMQAVPAGIAGELFIGGDGLAREYLHLPDLTAERFVPNPFSESVGARLYESGDLARYLSDGRIEFLGRSDNQVKVRGFRIELNEIERVLNSHQAVRDSVVVAREGENASKQLVAYFVTRHDEPPAAADLRAHLQQRLPDFMLPALFVRIDGLPLNPNGKVDRKALPPPDRQCAGSKDTAVAPRTPVEKKLADIWKRILRREEVGIRDNFFELGGDSILSIQISLLANQAGLKLAPKHLFQHQTIAELAMVVEAASPQFDEQGAVSGPAPLTPIQRRFFEQRVADPHHYNQAVMFELRKPVDAALLEKVVRRLLGHHDALRMRFTPTGSGWSQYNAAIDERAPFSSVDLTAVAETEKTKAIEAAAAELQSSLDLSNCPLMRVALFNLGHDQAQKLLLIIHHLVVDGVSWRILLSDLELAYDQLSRGEAVELPAKTASFKRWAEGLSLYAASDEAEKESDHWLRQAQADQARLPVDFPGGLNIEESAASVLLSLSVEETRALVEEAPKAYGTQINDVLLAALAKSLSRLWRSRSVLIDLEGHGREEILEDMNLSRTVGWFTSLFPALLNVEPGDDSLETLKSIRAQLHAIPHRGIGYGILRYLREAGEIGERLARAPQPEIVFNYLGQADQILMDSSLLRESGLDCGPPKSPRAMRPYLLEIVAIVESGQFQIRWIYSGNLHRHATIEKLARSYMKVLQELIGGAAQLTRDYTPADFPLVNLDQDQLDKVLSKLKLR